MNAACTNARWSAQPVQILAILMAHTVGAKQSWGLYANVFLCTYALCLDSRGAANRRPGKE